MTSRIDPLQCDRDNDNNNCKQQQIRLRDEHEEEERRGRRINKTKNPKQNKTNFKTGGEKNF